MAILKTNPLGQLSGRVGNIVFRNVNGKTIISQRPVYSEHPLSSKEKLRRSKFTTAVRFAKEVNQHPLLHQIWELSYRTPWNTILKLNLPKVSQFIPTTENIIVPSGGFPVSIVYDKISTKSIKFHIIDFPAEFSITCTPLEIIALNCWINPFNRKEKPFIIEATSQKYPIANIIKGSSLTLSDRYTYESVSDIYKNKIIYFVLILASSTRDKIIYSETISLEI